MNRASPHRAFLILAAFILACGDDGGTISDGGADVDAGPAARAALPDIPWLDDGVPPVALTPCPDGWREVSDGRVIECDPYPETGRLDCADGEAHFPGEPTCRPIGAPCPAGELPVDLPAASRTIYVDDSAPAGGDGSSAAPFASLSAVSWSSLEPGTVVALAKGDYEGTLPLRPGVTVVGACARDTRLLGLNAAVASVVTVTRVGEAPVIRNLSIVDAPQPGVLVGLGRSIRVEGVLIDGVDFLGVVGDGEGTSVELEEVVVRGVRDRAADGWEARAVSAQGPARIDANRLVVEGSHGFGFYVVDHATGSLSDSVVVGSDSRGVSVEEVSTLTLSRTLVDDNVLRGIIVDGVGSTANIEDVVVRGTVERAEDGIGGGGVLVRFGGALEASRLLVTDNTSAGIAVAAPGSRATITDVVVRDTTGEAADSGRGVGIAVTEEASLTTSRGLVHRNEAVGIFVSLGASVDLSDYAIIDMEPAESDGRLGRGMSVERGARVTAARLSVDGAIEAGLVVHTDAEAILEDSAIVRTRSNALSGLLGHAVHVQAQASLTADRLLVTDAERVGVGVTEATAELRDLTVRRVVPACRTTECAPYGYAVGAESGDIAVTRFEIHEADTCGVILFDNVAPVAVDLHDGVIAGSTIGACVQAAGYDLTRLQDRVVFRDNDSNLEATMLPVPGAASIIGEDGSGF